MLAKISKGPKNVKIFLSKNNVEFVKQPKFSSFAEFYEKGAKFTLINSLKDMLIFASSWALQKEWGAGGSCFFSNLPLGQASN